MKKNIILVTAICLGLNATTALPKKADASLAKKAFKVVAITTAVAAAAYAAANGLDYLAKEGKIQLPKFITDRYEAGTLLNFTNTKIVNPIVDFSKTTYNQAQDLLTNAKDKTVEYYTVNKPKVIQYSKDKAALAKAKAVQIYKTGTEKLAQASNIAKNKANNYLQAIKDLISKKQIVKNVYNPVNDYNAEFSPYTKCWK